MTDHDHRLLRAAAWAMCELIDDQVGRMLAALEETGQEKNTLVIFMSDHGELLGDHGMYLKGPHFYEEAVRVPLILSWPGILPQGQRCPELVELVDLAPTLLEAAGLPPHPGMQGTSLWPGLASRQGDLVGHRQDVYCEFYNAAWGRDQEQSRLCQSTMVRTARHKLVVHHALDTGELYDLENDPGEVRNLWNDPAAAAVQGTMLLRLTHRMAWTVDPLPLRRAGY
jgi:arylsulfatase A-like enzyme